MKGTLNPSSAGIRGHGVSKIQFQKKDIMES